MTPKSQSIDIAGTTLHYLEQGEGDPILFLHSIPMSSYIWRNIIPYVSWLGRCIALDFVGFGKSDHPNIQYRIDDHIHYLQAFIDKLNLKHITLVMHGFGSIIGFHYAQHHKANCKGLVFYESFLRSIKPEVLSLPLQEQIITLEDVTSLPDFSHNGLTYIDKMLPQFIMNELSHQLMDYYRSPFLEDRSYTQISSYLQLFRDGAMRQQANQMIESYSQWLTKTNLPKLLLYSIPGFITTVATVMWAKDNLPELEIIDFGEELHLGQETYPEMIGESISVWLQGIEQNALMNGDRNDGI